MRIAVMGTGAVGGYFGAKLAASGHDLVFIARGSHLKALCREGLRVVSPGGDLHIRNALFTADITQARGADLLLFCVKSYDTESAGDALKGVSDDNAVILSLQNGIDNMEKLARRFGASRILGGVVYVGAQVVSPGVIEHSSGGRIVFGPMARSTSESAKRIGEVLAGAAIPCELSLEIEKAQWRKLLWNAPFCAISCLTGATVKDIVESEALSTLALDCMEEVARAAKARGVDLAAALFQETLDFSKTLGAFKPSMLQDMETGKPLEHEAFNGVVVKLLEGAGTSAPVNRVFHSMLQYLDKKNREESTY